MKNSSKIVRLIPLLLVAIMVFTGCQSAKEQVVTYKNEDASTGMSIVVTFYAKGDEVTKQTAETIMMYEPLGIADATAAKELMENAGVLEYDNIKGVEHSVEYLEDRLIEKTSTDYSVVDVAEIAKLQGTNTKGDIQKGTKISLKLSGEDLEKAGYVKVEGTTSSVAAAK